MFLGFGGFEAYSGVPGAAYWASPHRDATSASHGMPKVKVNTKIPKTSSGVRNYLMGAADFVPNNGLYGIDGITMVFVIVALQL